MIRFRIPRERITEVFELLTKVIDIADPEKTGDLGFDVQIDQSGLVLLKSPREEVEVSSVHV